MAWWCLWWCKWTISQFRLQNRLFPLVSTIWWWRLWIMIVIRSSCWQWCLWGEWGWGWFSKWWYCHHEREGENIEQDNPDTFNLLDTRPRADDDGGGDDYWGVVRFPNCHECLPVASGLGNLWESVALIVEVPFVVASWGPWGQKIVDGHFRVWSVFK